MKVCYLHIMLMDKIKYSLFAFNYGNKVGYINTLHKFRRKHIPRGKVLQRLLIMNHEHINDFLIHSGRQYSALV